MHCHPPTRYLDHGTNAISGGLMTWDDVDTALRHTLKLRFLLGLFDPVEDQPYWHVPPTVVNTKESQEFNLFATKQSMVLLKNDDNTLPFKVGSNIAVLGPHGNATRAMVGNYLGQICASGQNDFSCITTPFQAISEQNSGGRTTYAQGCTVEGSDKSGFAAAVAAAKAADSVVLLIGLDQEVEAEGHDRYNLTLPGVQQQLADAVLAVGKPTAIVLINGGMVRVSAGCGCVICVA